MKSDEYCFYCDQCLWLTIPIKIRMIIFKLLEVYTQNNQLFYTSKHTFICITSFDLFRKTYNNITLNTIINKQ